MNKSTVDEIRRRFDADVERFSNADTGQVSAVDGVLILELITDAAARLAPGAQALLDIGCGAGNYTLRMLQKMPALDCTLVDLSAPMLERAVGRVSRLARSVRALRGDIRDVPLEDGRYGIVLAGSVLHHLRGDSDWEAVFGRIARCVRPGGCFLVADLVRQETDAMTDYMTERYGAYLEATAGAEDTSAEDTSAEGGADYRRRVLEYIEREDSPRSLVYQIDLMRRVGFRDVEVLHKHLCFAAFGGIAPQSN
jgi:tRNA (cmo5U34)-methyltransferase